MEEADRLAVDEFGIDVLQMMELAGSHLAELVHAELDGYLDDRRVIVAVGSGNNGGGGLAAARRRRSSATCGCSARTVSPRPMRRRSTRR